MVDFDALSTAVGEELAVLLSQHGFMVVPDPSVPATGLKLAGAHVTSVNDVHVIRQHDIQHDRTMLRLQVCFVLAPKETTPNV
jgi:hypothetical protein